MGRKQQARDCIEALKVLAEAGLKARRPLSDADGAVSFDDLPSVDERVKSVLGVLDKPVKIEGRMLFFVMYDIEDNKVRRYVVKYLEKMGCIRVQKSIFLADLPSAAYNDIRQDLAEVQAAYENNDSIFVVPISTEYLRAMKIIGQNIDIDVIMHNKNTLFF